MGFTCCQATPVLIYRTVGVTTNAARCANVIRFTVGNAQHLHGVNFIRIQPEEAHQTHTVAGTRGLRVNQLGCHKLAR